MRKLLLCMIICVGALLSGCAVKTEWQEGECERLAEIVEKSVEFPPMNIITDESIIRDNIGLNPEDCLQLCVMQQSLSVDLSEIIVAIPIDGKKEDTIRALMKRADALQNQLAFYPEQAESVMGTVIGEKGGVVYLICHGDGASAEKALLNAID